MRGQLGAADTSSTAAMARRAVALDQQLRQAEALIERTRVQSGALLLERIAVYFQTSGSRVRYVEFSWDIDSLVCDGFLDEHGAPATGVDSDDEVGEWVRLISHPQECPLIYSGDDENGPYIVDLRQIPVDTASFASIDDAPAIYSRGPVAANGQLRTPPETEHEMTTPDHIAVCEVTEDDIDFAMKQANKDGVCVYSIIQGEDDPEVEVIVENERAKDLFMAALAEKSGHALSDLLSGGYLDNGEGEHDPDVENPSDFYYFPAMQIAEEGQSK